MQHLRTGDELARFEAEYLAPFASLSMASRGRRHEEAPRPLDPRLPYQHDRDRVQHSVSFRRLQSKTQVYAFHEGDFYRTRLTHSIEVAQIGRGIARLLRANEDLVEAISLAHDVGHPPFGHAGEAKLTELMQANGDVFEHNAQSLRTIDELELRYPGFPGMNLTWETREGVARHFTPYDHPEGTPEFDIFPNPSLEAQISSLADLIAYCTHDIEDALRTRLISSAALEQTSLWCEARATARLAAEAMEGPAERREDVEQRTAIRVLINKLLMDAAAATAQRLTTLGPASADAIRQLDRPVVDFSPELGARVEQLREYLYNQVYSDPRVLRMKFKGQMIIERLWEAFMDTRDSRSGVRLLPRRTQERLKDGPRHRVVCDYIAGMTDRHAMDIYNILYNAYEPTVHSFS